MDQSQRPTVYLEDLDTVKYDMGVISSTVVQGRSDTAYVALILYSIFYNIVLSPNQVLDLKLVRERFPISRFRTYSYPLIFTFFSAYASNSEPFKAQLLDYLNRHGDGAFYFSSINNSAKVKDNWGAIVESEKKKRSSGKKKANLDKITLPEDVIVSELKNAGFDEVIGILNWVNELDGNKNFLKPQAYTGEPYSQHFSSFVQDSQYDVSDLPGVPNARSQLYKWIDNFPEKRKSEIKDVADFVSNVQYAKGTRALRLTLELQSIFQVDPDVDSLVIDLGNLLSDAPWIREGILNSKPERILVAREESKSVIVEGWSLLSMNDRTQALLKFNEGFRIFFENLVENDWIRKVGKLEFIDNRKIGERSFIIPKSYFLKTRLKGIDKFINIS